jgi:hypothetical protein
MPYVYMRFTFGKQWTCDFTNQFTQQRVRTLHFTDPEKVRELAQRGKALTDLSSKNNFEHGIRNGGGGVILELSDFQYDKLIGKDDGRTS